MASRVISKWFGPSQEARNYWDRFAEQDPHLYILTSMKRTDPSAFWRSGEQTVSIELLPFIQTRDVRPFVALELGCGIGRLALPLARHFRQVIGVDITRGMVERASSFAKDNGIKNVSFEAISGPEDFMQNTGEFAQSCDFIYSLLVFQHIPELSMIERYLHMIRSLLQERGVAYLQFDTRRSNILYRLKTRLPDFLLPRFWRRGIRRIRRSPAEIESCIQRAGLEIVEQLAPESEYHRYVLRLQQSKPGPK
jgi:SAM-dependent methyltransferase